jgi:RNA polymerase sigma-70 factor (subfamily 1)
MAALATADPDDSDPESGPELDGSSDPASHQRPEGEHDPDLANTLDLLRRSKFGDGRALGALFERYYPRILRMVRGRLSAELRAEMDSGDALHEALLNALKGLPDFEVRTNQELAAWFVRVVENHLRSAGRAAHAQKRDRDREVPLESLKSGGDESSPDGRPADVGATPLELTSLSEQHQIYRECVEELEPDQREVIQLRLGQRLSWADIAERTGRSPDAARMFFGRAAAELQKILRRRGLDSTS